MVYAGPEETTPYKVVWGDGEVSDWLQPRDIVLDEAAAKKNDFQALLQKEKTKLEEAQAQILSDFKAKCRDLATKEKISWYTKAHLFDGTHGANRCVGVHRALADAGWACAGSIRTPTTNRP